ncbi:MAG: serine/threonine-protein kinase [Myxococcota bacterium]
MRSVGTYEVLRTLARGGMAELLLARAKGRHGFQKLVVLKRIHPHLADDPGFVEMFLDEARLAGQLDHPNVVQVFDIGEGDDGVFFAMEYLDGLDVRRLIAECGALPLAHAVAIAVGAASGLHYAHTKVGLDGKPLAVIHRDVSPNNIIVTFEGAVKLLDFGIAKATSNQRHTQQSRLKGKVAYMSPEQCAGSRLGASSDVFALGTVLYEMTTGRRPFEGDTEFALMSEILNRRVVAPSEHRPEIPPDLEAIVLGALERAPERRFESAGAMRRALESFARDARYPASAADLGEFAREHAPPDEDVDASTDVPMGLDAATGTAPTVAAAETLPPRPPARRRSAWLAAGLVATGAAALVLLQGQTVPDAPTGTAAEPEPAAVAGAPAPPMRAPASTPPTPPPVEREPPEPPPVELALEPSTPDAGEAAAVVEPRPTEAPARPVRTRARRPRPAKRTGAPPRVVDGNEWVPIRRETP